MPYSKNVPAWVEGAAPGISAARLNHLETQFEEFQKMFNAFTILASVDDDTPLALSIPASRIVGRKAAGNIVALTGAELMAILSGQAGADFSVNTHKITAVVDPTANQHAATKKYHDDNVRQIATGTYNGTDANDRQITTGFKCSLVIVIDSVNQRRWTCIPNKTIFDASANDNLLRTDVLLHATDGFVVDQAEANDSGNDPYYYWAISE